jgi:hypothetical protein
MAVRNIVFIILKKIFASQSDKNEKFYAVRLDAPTVLSEDGEKRPKTGLPDSDALILDNLMRLPTTGF